MNCYIFLCLIIHNRRSIIITITIIIIITKHNNNRDTQQTLILSRKHVYVVEKKPLKGSALDIGSGDDLSTPSVRNMGSEKDTGQVI